MPSDSGATPALRYTGNDKPTLDPDQPDIDQWVRTLKNRRRELARDIRRIDQLVDLLQSNADIPRFVRAWRKCFKYL